MKKVKEDKHMTTVSGFARPFGVKFNQTGGILVADFGSQSIARPSKIPEVNERLGKISEKYEKVQRSLQAQPCHQIRFAVLRQGEICSNDIGVCSKSAQD